MTSMAIHMKNDSAPAAKPTKTEQTSMSQILDRNKELLDKEKGKNDTRRAEDFRREKDTVI